MYKKILVPLDGSLRAEKILSHVEALAAQNEAEVVLLQVVEPASAEFTPSLNMMVTPQELDLYWKSLQAAETAAKDYLKKKVADLDEKKISAQGVVKRGEAVAAIIEVAKKEKVDLIAMASHGRTGLARVFYGSVANGLLHKVDRPLLLIRAEE
jgi:nucleotide-binding universal stress UspA family protein